MSPDNDIMAAVDAMTRPETRPETHAALDAVADLLQAGGVAQLTDGGRLYAGNRCLEHDAVAWLRAVAMGWLEPKFGARLRVTVTGRDVVLRRRRPDVERDDEAALGMGR